MTSVRVVVAGLSGEPAGVVVVRLACETAGAVVVRLACEPITSLWTL